jgi:uncharacterized protein
MKKLWIALLALTACVFSAAQSAPSAKKHLLVLGEQRGYRHESVSHALATIERLGNQTGLWDTTIFTDTEVLTKKKLEYNAKNLNDFDAVVFFTGGELEMNPSQKADLLSFVHDDGKGFVGVHSATITFAEWPEYGEMIGGYFDGHPWHQEVRVKVEDSSHPATKGLPAVWTLKDEIYQFRNWDRSKRHVLLSLDTTSVDLKKDGVKRTDGDFALAWTSTYGKGRVFYSALGHRDDLWQTPEYQQFIAGGIRWALGLE